MNMNMTLLEFINRISPEEYFVSGTYHEAARHSAALPAEGVGRFLQDGESLLFEGSYRHNRGTTSHQFAVKIPLDLSEAGGVEISSLHTGRLVGHVLTAGNGLEVLAWRDGASIFSCHVEANATGSCSSMALLDSPAYALPSASEGARTPTVRRLETWLASRVLVERRYGASLGHDKLVGNDCNQIVRGETAEPFTMNSHIVLAFANAEKLRALTARVNETVDRRWHSAADKVAWETACREFHSQFNHLFFPGGIRAWTAFMSGESGAIDPAIAFLEADPWSFRSGYHKQILWNKLKRASLTLTETGRLEAVALNYLEKRVRREFWHMARFVRARGSDSFWQTVETFATAEARSPRAIKATWLLRSRRNEDIRRYVANDLRRARYEPGYVPSLDVPLQEQKAAQGL